MIEPLALVLVSLFALVSPRPAAVTPTQQSGPCTNADGVTVVVDFQELGGGVNVVCASGPVSSGLEALTRAGVSFRTAQRFPGFVCRIADKPADPCVNASPPSAYWAYWLAAPGGQWCYSTLGAGSRKPPTGTFEGWSFALDHTASQIPPPRFSPPAVPAGGPVPTLNTGDCVSTPSTLPATTAPATTAPATTVPPTTAPATTTTPTTTTALTTTTTPATTTAPTTTAVASTTTISDVTTAASDLVASATTVDLSEDGGDGGSPLAFVVSAAVVVGIGTGAVVIARRRGARTRSSS